MRSDTTRTEVVVPANQVLWRVYVDASAHSGQDCILGLGSVGPFCGEVGMAADKKMGAGEGFT